MNSDEFILEVPAELRMRRRKRKKDDIMSAKPEVSRAFAEAQLMYDIMSARKLLDEIAGKSENDEYNYNFSDSG